MSRAYSSLQVSCVLLHGGNHFTFCYPLGYAASAHVFLAKAIFCYPLGFLPPGFLPRWSVRSETTLDFKYSPLTGNRFRLGCRDREGQEVQKLQLEKGPQNVIGTEDSSRCWILGLISLSSFLNFAHCMFTAVCCNPRSNIIFEEFRGASLCTFRSKLSYQFLYIMLYQPMLPHRVQTARGQERL